MGVWRGSAVVIALHLMLLGLTAAGCTSLLEPAQGGETAQAMSGGIEASTTLHLPDLKAADLGDGKLRAVATTSIIADIVSQIGGEAITLTPLMEPGEDPHSYEPSAADLTAVARAHVIFVNGWDLEESLVADLENISEGAPLVPVSAGVKPLKVAPNPVDDETEKHEGNPSSIDPHTWLDPHLMRQWVKNVEQTLARLDPANAALYEQNTDSYLTELEELIAYYDQRVASIPVERRKLVTNHDSFGYFARAYDFSIIGTVVPAASTLAEPSATELARLVEAMERETVCIIFAETTANDQLAEAISAELEGCPEVQIIHLFTGALGPLGGDADSYLKMMRVNIDAIADALE